MMMGRAYPAVMATGRMACTHRIRDARNRSVQSGYFCVDCGAMFAAADHAELTQPAVPEGFVVVPIEPTQAMLEAAFDAGMLAWEECAGPYPVSMMTRMYAAMIAAHQATTETK